MLNDKQAANALTVLTRLAQRDPSRRGLLKDALQVDLTNLAPIALRVGLETGAPMPAVLAEALRENATGAVIAKRLEIPINTVSLLELAGEAAAAGVTASREGTREHAVALLDQAQRLADLASFEEAEAAAGAGLRELRSIDAEDESVPRALWILSRCLTLTGKHDQAISAAREAVDVLRPQREERNIEWAYAVANLAQALSQTEGREDEALATSGQAVEAFRQAVASLPRKLTYQLEDAKDSGQQIYVNLAPGTSSPPDPPGYFAVDVDHRSLVDPANVIGGLASSLVRRAKALFFVGAIGEMRDAADEAVKLSRELAEDQPDAYTVLLGIALAWKASSLAEEHTATALPLAMESVELLHAQVGGLAIYRGEVHAALMPLAWILMTMRKWDAALSTMVELESVWDPTDAQGRIALQDQFETLSAELASAGENHKALEASRHAVAVARAVDAALGPMDDSRGSQVLAGALHNLSRRAHAAADDDSGRAASAEAIRIAATLLPSGGLSPRVAMMILWQYVSVLHQPERPLDLQLPLAEVFSDCCRLLEGEPQVADPIARMASTLSEGYRRGGRLDAACAVLDATYAYASGTPGQPGPWRGYALAAFNLTQSLLEESRYANAERVVEHLVGAQSADPLVVRETGRAAAIVMTRYDAIGEVERAAHVALMAEDALRSDQYLLARREELGERSADEFLASLDLLTGRDQLPSKRLTWWARRRHQSE